MSKHSEAKAKAQAFFAKKNEEKSGKKSKEEEGKEEKKTDTSKMPEGLRKYYEKKKGK